MPLDKSLALEIATELTIEPSFIEKDFYATKVMRVISSLSAEGISPLFCGGTSLSKAYGIIERFSEDLDYRGLTEDGATPSKGARSRYRKLVVAALNDIEGIRVDESSLKAGGNYFKMDLTYDPVFEIPDSLREKLQVEFSYTQPAYSEGFQERSISSFTDAYVGADPLFSVQCISPVETAADKLSALVWRVIKRDRTSDKDDPSIVRHLHDLHALRDYISNNLDQFKSLVERSHSIDAATSNRNTGMPIWEAARKAHNMIITDAEYEKEYSRFVKAMSYEHTSNRATMEEVSDHLKSIIIQSEPVNIPSI